MTTLLSPQNTPLVIPAPGTECEIFREGLNFVLYTPSKHRWQGRMELDAYSYVSADAEARKLGFELQWG